MRPGSGRRDEAPAWKPRAGSLLAVLWPIDRARSSPRSGRHRAGRRRRRTVRMRDTLCGKRLCRVPLDWSPASAVPGAVRRAAAPAARLREDTPAFDWAGETARRVGSLVHAELQIMDLGRASRSVDAARDAPFPALA